MPRFQDLIDRYVEVHLPHLAPTNASDQKSMLTKLVAPHWGYQLVTEITPYDVDKLLTRIAAGRSRPSKTKPNNRARKLQGSKPTPIWGLRGLIDHWNRKHAKAVYVPSLARNPPPEYCYGNRPKLCEGTGFVLLIRAMASGAVYLDPAVKMENAGSAKPAIKRRNQFTVAHTALGDLYQKSELHNLV